MKKTLTRTAEITPQMRAEIDAVAALDDAGIDTVDIPEAPYENMKNGWRGPQFRPLKTPVTIRLDADVVAWFKAHAESGKYQSEINRVLRQHMVSTGKRDIQA